MNSALNVVAWGCMLLCWISISCQLWAVPPGGHESYDPSPSSILVCLVDSDHRSYGLDPQHCADTVIDGTYNEVTSPYYNYQASGYISAPVGGIIINPRSYNALYFPYGLDPIVRQPILLSDDLWWFGTRNSDIPVLKLGVTPNVRKISTAGIAKHYTSDIHVGGGSNTKYSTPTELAAYKSDWSVDMVHDLNVKYKFMSYMVETHART
ncbi:hypothetical protein PILCRDRAFT_87578 [Piloderma croceum F 1598]|uniref:Uncharacterized protein n=1 Tax=Piloderma croceum (strain F 1598) TaxID=765440 RepID=A0A0C3C3F1_PILCF|nr:hypothetical protein PILCRDRAFT_87578 [Piloderma croceum F 1598]